MPTNFYRYFILGVLAVVINSPLLAKPSTPTHKPVASASPTASVLPLPSITPTPGPAPTPDPKPIVQPTPDPTVEILKAQLEATKAQLENTKAQLDATNKLADAQKSFNERILGTVNTFIIAYVTVFGLVSVGGIVSLFRQGSTQRKALRAEVERKISALDTSVTEKLTGIDKRVEDATKLALSNVDDVLKATFNRIAMLDHRLTADDATRFEGDGDIAAALYSLSACVSSANTVDTPWMVQRDLREMLRVLEQNHGNKVDITATYPQMLLNLKGTPPQVKQTLKRVTDELRNLYDAAKPQEPIQAA